MIDRKGRDEPLVSQIQEEIVDVLSQEHAFVDQRFMAERTDVERRDRRLASPPLNPPAANIKSALKFFRRTATRIPEHDLLNRGARILCLLSDYGDIHRRLAPAIDIEAEMQHFPLNQGAGCFLRAEIRARHEYLPYADPVIRRAVTRAADMLAKEILRHIKADTRAVAGFSIGIHSAAVPDILQCADAHLDDLAARLAIERDNETHAAGIAFVLGIISPRINQALAVLLILCHIIRHLSYSAATFAACSAALIALCIASAASRPSLIAQTTRDAPRTISPAA